MKNELIDHVQQILLSILEQSYLERKFSSAAFYGRWFKHQGGSHFILFKKNLHVTNLQYGELVALLKAYVTLEGHSGMINDLQFMSSREFKDALERLVGSFPIDPANPTPGLTKVASMYAPLLAKTVIVDSYFSSCSVSLPPHMSLNPAELCGKAGYIHSCGQNVFIRNMAKIQKQEFFNSLHDHLDRTSNGKKTVFIVYAQEDFTPYDRDKAAELRYGPDEVKIFLEKCYMGNDRLVSVLKEMREVFKNQLIIPEPGDYRDFRKAHGHDSDVHNDRTLWLIVDHSVDEQNHRHPGTDTFFVCYEQHFLNENPFHVFDENKPAWIAHTTIPHTLAAAMINITKPSWPDKGTVTLCDPFVGGGTVLFESTKYGRIKSRCSDSDPIAELIVHDNAHYLSSPPTTIRKYVGVLHHFEDETRLRKLIARNTSSRLITDLVQAFEMANAFEAAEKQTDPTKWESLVRKLGRLNHTKRLLFYVGLRASRRHAALLEWGSEFWIGAYCKEAKTLNHQFSELLSLRERTTIDRVKRTQITQGHYSRCCTLDLASLLRSTGKDRPEVEQRDATALPHSAYDVIVTDPPYGINTHEDRFELATLYCAMSEVLIQALKPDGQIVVCLPEEARTGQDVPFFAHREIFTQQVLIAARKLGREVTTVACSVPRLPELYRAPYYWESDKALRRSIVHFQLRVLRK